MSKRKRDASSASGAGSRDDAAASEADGFLSLGQEFQPPRKVRKPGGEAKPINGAPGSKKAEKEARKRDRELEAKYSRGFDVAVKSIPDKKLRGNLQRTETKFKHASRSAAKAEILHTEAAGYLEAEGLEKTYHFSQDALRDNVDMATRQKMFSLDLEFGPYRVNYTRDGRFLLMGGQKGHLAVIDWARAQSKCEVHARETVRDVTFLHNQTMFAAAQKKYVYIYDATGTEIHCLRNHLEVNRLKFLPYHWLLATVGSAGFLKYQDTSTGSIVAEHRTKLGACEALAVNPWNAIVHLGHGNGTVTLWSPNVSQAQVKMLCHRGPVLDLAIDRGGHYMVTTGMDRQAVVWDVRTYKKLHAYGLPRPATSVSISETGMVGFGWGAHAQVWRDALASKARSPYMNHLLPGSDIANVAFVPYEDFMGIGHAGGVASIAVPGSGEPNIDTHTANPFQTTKQRQEDEVRRLIEKIQPEMIVLNPDTIGTVDRAAVETQREERRLEYEANHLGEKFVPKNKMKKRNTSLKRYLKRKENVVEKKREDIKSRQARQQEAIREQRERKAGTFVPKPASVLDRFSKHAPADT